MLPMVLRKMLNNSWMVLCLLLGSLLAVALIASIPVYTEGILQRLLTRDLEDYQVARAQYPGRSLVTRSFVMPDDPDGKLPLFRSLDEQIGARLPAHLGVPVLASTLELTLDYLQAYPQGAAPGASEEVSAPFIKVAGLRGLADHISMIAGNPPQRPGLDGIIDGVITEKAVRDLGLRLGSVYDVWDSFYTGTKIATVRISGVFTIADPRDPWWFRDLGDYAEGVLVDFDTLKEGFVDTMSASFSAAAWYVALDYHAIRIGDVPGITSRVQAAQRLAQSSRVNWDIPLFELLRQYGARAAVLKVTLWLLDVPMLLMLAFFIYMVSQLIIESDANEIAVLKSRGSSSWQVFLTYLVESVLLSAVALAVGPPLGFLVCGMLGSSRGFLEFVQRTALPLTLSPRSYLYALLGAALFVAAMLLPALVASRVTIVAHKRKTGRGAGKPAWRRFYIDVALVAVSLYGLYSYSARRRIVTITGASGSALPLDPLLFVISVAFILGLGMLFLRLYPLLVRALFRVGRKAWSPAAYASFVQVGRSIGHEQFLMLFLILSLGLGVYNAIAARTINRNAEDKIRYAVGADIVMQPHWMDAAPAPAEERGSLPGGDAPVQQGRVIHHWMEPPFEPYQDIAGTDLATKVYRNDEVIASCRSGSRILSVMGVEPNEFAKVAWFRPDLLPAHQNAFLNLLAASPKAVLVSSNLRTEYDLKLGDSFTITWNDQAPIDVYIYAFVDYWPTFNPAARTEDRVAGLVVANLSYLQDKMAIEPYQVWLRKTPGTASKVVFDSIRAKGLEIETLRDTAQDIVALSNDPTLQGTNGTLTLGFLIAMGISFLGFVIYWVLSLKARTLQFGILRAMGLHQGKVLSMLLLEQLLISGAAIVAGLVIGDLASALFVPLLQLTTSATEQVPPFRIVSLPADFIRMAGVAVAMLALGAVLFRWMVSRIRIHQALKLGEE